MKQGCCLIKKTCNRWHCYEIEYFIFTYWCLIDLVAPIGYAVVSQFPVIYVHCFFINFRSDYSCFDNLLNEICISYGDN